MLVAAAMPAAALAQDAKAAKIIATTRTAIGAGKLDAMKTFSLQASTERNLGQVQITGEVDLLLEMPDKYLRSEASRGAVSMTMNSGFNGDKAIMPAGTSMMPGGGMMVRMGPGGAVPAEAARLTDEQKDEINKSMVRAARSEVSRMMLGWFGAAHPSLGAHYTYAGEAESPDGKAHVIDVKDADGFEARLFIDQKSSLPLMVTYKGRAPRVVMSNGPAGRGAQALTHAAGQAAAEQPLVELALFFEDWRQADGINFPHVMRRAAAGETTEQWTINKVKVNPKIDTKKFDVGDGRS